MSKVKKVDNKDGLKYEKTRVKKRNVAAKPTRAEPNYIVNLHSKVARKANDLVKLRLLSRVSKVEDVLKAPFLYDDHGLEDYIRMIVRDEKGKK